MRSKTKRRIAALAASTVLCVAGLGATAGAASADPPPTKVCWVFESDPSKKIALPALPTQAPVELHAPIIGCLTY
jgi:hypothetical protein